MYGGAYNREPTGGGQESQARTRGNEGMWKVKRRKLGYKRADSRILLHLLSLVTRLETCIGAKGLRRTSDGLDGVRLSRLVTTNPRPDWLHDAHPIFSMIFDIAALLLPPKQT